jgi:hypothetical protein
MIGVTIPVLNFTSLLNGQLQLSWNSGGTLESATNVLGPYIAITGVSPYTPPITNSQMFYRLLQ